MMWQGYENLFYNAMLRLPRAVPKPKKIEAGDASPPCPVPSSHS